MRLWFSFLKYLLLLIHNAQVFLIKWINKRINKKLEVKWLIAAVAVWTLSTCFSLMFYGETSRQFTCCTQRKEFYLQESNIWPEHSDKKKSTVKLEYPSLRQEVNMKPLILFLCCLCSVAITLESVAVVLNTFCWILSLSCFPLAVFLFK